MLNERIKELRQAKRMTQVDLAKSLGLTKQCVSNWENDNVLPSVEMLSRLADFFGVSTDYLLCRDEGHTLNVGGLSPVESAHVQEIVSDLKKRKI